MAKIKKVISNKMIALLVIYSGVGSLYLWKPQMDIWRQQAEERKLNQSIEVTDIIESIKSESTTQTEAVPTESK